MGSDSEQEIDFFFLEKKIWRRQDIISWLSKSLKKKEEIEFSFVVNQLYFQRQSLLKNLTVEKKQGAIFEKHQQKQSSFLLGDTLFFSFLQECQQFLDTLRQWWSLSLIRHHAAIFNLPSAKNEVPSPVYQ